MTDKNAADTRSKAEEVIEILNISGRPLTPEEMRRRLSHTGRVPRCWC